MSGRDRARWHAAGVDPVSGVLHWHPARDAIKDSGAHPFTLLGFDPLERCAWLKHLYRA